MLTKLAKSRYGLASARVVFTLPNAGLDPQPIGIQQWYRLPLHERAPARSVAMVDVVGERFLALVVDTVRGSELWLIVGHISRLGLVYDGMVVGSRERGTLVMSARLRSRLKPLPFLDGDSEAMTAGSDPDHCESPVVVKAVHGSYPGGGSPGLVVTASVVSDVTSGLEDGDQGDLRDNDSTESVLVVSPDDP